MLLKLQHGTVVSNGMGSGRRQDTYGMRTREPCTLPRRRGSRGELSDTITAQRQDVRSWGGKQRSGHGTPRTTHLLGAVVRRISKCCSARRATPSYIGYVALYFEGKPTRSLYSSGRLLSIS